MESELGGRVGEGGGLRWGPAGAKERGGARWRGEALMIGLRDGLGTGWDALLEARLEPGEGLKRGLELENEGGGTEGLRLGR